MYQVVAKRNDTAAAKGKMTRGRRSKSSAMAKRNDAQQLVRNIAVMVWREEASLRSKVEIEDVGG